MEIIPFRKWVHNLRFSKARNVRLSFRLLHHQTSLFESLIGLRRIVQLNTINLFLGFISNISPIFCWKVLIHLASNRSYRWGKGGVRINAWSRSLIPLDILLTRWPYQQFNFNLFSEPTILPVIPGIFLQLCDLVRQHGHLFLFHYLPSTLIRRRTVKLTFKLRLHHLSVLETLQIMPFLFAFLRPMLTQ